MIRAGKLKPRSLGFAIAVLLSCVSIDVSQRAIAQSSSEFAQSITTQSNASELEKAILEETNLLRRDPQAYADLLAQLKSYYQDKILALPQEIQEQTQEGVSAVDEAIAALKAASSLPELTLSSGLSRAARDHATDIGSKGLVSHTGSDKSTMRERMDRYGEWSGSSAENITFNSSLNARRHIMALLIDDGVPNRGHRKNLLNPALKVTGVACAPHSQYGYTCVMTYAGEYTEKVQSSK